jgi:hypothetical protein
MDKKKKYYIGLYLILLFFAVIYVANYSRKTVSSFLHILDLSASLGEDNSQIESIPYKKDGISASYPQFISGASEKERDIWNRLIQDDFNKILQIYSFNPFPEPTPNITAVVPTILEINYSIKSNNKNLFSLFYSAYYNSTYSAHPSDLIYTTNIDKLKNRKYHLSDMVNLNLDFVKDFRSWDLIPSKGVNEDLQQAIRDYIKDMTDEDLLQGFQSADNISSENPWGVFSYVTPDSLGISISVPHYAGDHAEYESPFSKLGDFLKADFSE